MATELTIVETPRLALRLFEPGDCAELFAMLGSVMPKANLADEAAVAQWIEQRQIDQRTNGYSMWAIKLRSGSELVGNCGFVGDRDGVLELGYGLGADYRGQGFATEAATAAMTVGFDQLKAASIVATVRPPNDASIAVAGRLGLDQVESVFDDQGERLVFQTTATQHRLRGLRAASLRRAENFTASFDDIVEATTDVATDDEHDPEGHTIAWERQQFAALLSEEHAMLAAIKAAEDRFASGTYGLCTECSGAIGHERLAVLPATPTCINCAP